jgi:hypothetical protein
MNQPQLITQLQKIRQKTNNLILCDNLQLRLNEINADLTDLIQTVKDEGLDDDNISEMVYHDDEPMRDESRD